MDLNPKTETGSRLTIILNEWIQRQPENAAVDMLKRVFLMYSPKIINEDSFIVALYGQRVVDEPLLNLRKELTTTLLRIQHAIALSVSKKRIKELVVALEWSENGNVLTEILKWAEDATKADVTAAMNSLSIDLAPVRAVRTLSSLFSRESLAPPNPREREIVWEEGNTISVIVICKKKIIVGWVTGVIELYSSGDLQCQTVLPYYKGKHLVRWLQCTCTEIIAGYDDGNICVWNIENGILIQELPVRNEGNEPDSVRCMRLRIPKFVVATDCRRVMIWQYVNAFLSILGNWITENRVSRVDFDSKYVILLVCHFSYSAFAEVSPVKVYHWNGELARNISGITCDMAFHNGHVITGGADKVLRIWDAKTGRCSKQLQGHGAEIKALYGHENYVVSADAKGDVIIWNIEAALNGTQSGSVRVAHSVRMPVPTEKKFLRLGRYFFMIRSGDFGSEKLTVVDFP